MSSCISISVQAAANPVLATTVTPVLGILVVLVSKTPASKKSTGAMAFTSTLPIVFVPEGRAGRDVTSTSPMSTPEFAFSVTLPIEAVPAANFPISAVPADKTV